MWLAVEAGPVFELEQRDLGVVELEGRALRADSRQLDEVVPRGGLDVAHSSERPQPHGSGPATLGVRDVFQTL